MGFESLLLPTDLPMLYLVGRRLLGISFDIQNMTWDVFERLFKENYFKFDYLQLIVDEFETLYQGSMTIIDY